MYYYAYAVAKPVASQVALQIAQQTLVNAGFQIFDPLQPGKLAIAGTHLGAGVMVTVVAIDNPGGCSVAVNGFCTCESAYPDAQSMAETVGGAIQYA
jgi:hypothetical protein